MESLLTAAPENKDAPEVDGPPVPVAADVAGAADVAHHADVLSHADVASLESSRAAALAAAFSPASSQASLLLVVADVAAPLPAVEQLATAAGDSLFHVLLVCSLAKVAPVCVPIKGRSIPKPWLSQGRSVSASSILNPDPG